nr:hypothetical protein [uncultured Cohaesibacter sp.]
MEKNNPTVVRSSLESRLNSLRMKQLFEQAEESRLRERFNLVYSSTTKPGGPMLQFDSESAKISQVSQNIPKSAASRDAVSSRIERRRQPVNQIDKVMLRIYHSLIKIEVARPLLINIAQHYDRIFLKK